MWSWRDEGSRCGSLGRDGGLFLYQVLIYVLSPSGGKQMGFGDRPGFKSCSTTDKLGGFGKFFYLSEL